MPKPKRVYYVEQSGAKLRYGQKGGGLFAQLRAMLERARVMEAQGATTKTFYADVEWKELTDVEVE